MCWRSLVPDLTRAPLDRFASPVLWHGDCRYRIPAETSLPGWGGAFPEYGSVAARLGCRRVVTTRFYGEQNARDEAEHTIADRGHATSRYPDLPGTQLLCEAGRRRSVRSRVRTPGPGAMVSEPGAREHP